MRRVLGPRSVRAVNMFLALYGEGPLYARELKGYMGLRSSRHVYPYAAYWARRGMIRILRGSWGANLYGLTVRGRAMTRELMEARSIREPDEGVLRILLRRLHAKGLRDRIYGDVVRALYYMVKDKDRTPYVRAPTARDLARLFLTVLRDRGYTEEQILQAIEVLHEAGVILRSKGSKGSPWAVGFTHGFTKYTGVISVPPLPAPGPPVATRPRRRRP